jgi:hypothetical protein
MESPSALVLLMRLDITLFLDTIKLLEVRLDALVNILEFRTLPVSFSAFDIRLFILDFKSVEKSFVAFIGLVSVAKTFTNDKVKIYNILSTIII